MLHLFPISPRVTKGHILSWLIEAGGVEKAKVGTISLRGREATVEVPTGGVRSLVGRLDGTQLAGRGVHVWFASPNAAPDTTGHFKKLRDHLEREAKAQAEALREARETDVGGARLERLVPRGQDIGLGGMHLLTFGRKNPMAALPHTALKSGSPIRLLGHGTDIDVRGIVTRTQPASIEVGLSQLPETPLDDCERFTIEAAEDETALGRARTAMHLAQHAQGGRLAELRDVLLHQHPPRDPKGEPPTFLNPSLDDSQRAAVTAALHAPDLAIIHGPPGTGKTTTLVELIRQANRHDQQVLACAPSNLAVDNLVEKLRDAGERVLRLGHPVRMTPQVRDCALSQLAAKHRDMKQVKKYRSQAQVLFKKADRAERDARRELRNEAKSLLDDARSLERDILSDLLRDTPIVCSTNTGLDVSLLGKHRFDLVVVDEACQCTEADAWIPLLRAERVVFAGDPCQLPPTVISREAEQGGFAVSLPERLLENGIASHLLSVQYRMHEKIMRFSSEQFYQGQLTAHPSVAAHVLQDLEGVLADEETEKPLRFIDTSGALYDEQRDNDTGSTANPDEAKLAAKKAADLLHRGLPPTAIAIITPYSAQVDAVRAALSARSEPELDGIEVGTIDGFQGREKEAVIITAVRSNTEQKIGFLSDTRRMNVALTRARRKLILIGDSATLSSHSFYSALLDHFGNADAYHVVWEEEE